MSMNSGEHYYQDTWNGIKSTKQTPFFLAFGLQGAKAADRVPAASRG